MEKKILHIESSAEYPLQSVKGIGPQRAEALAKAGITSVEDLVTFFPRKYIDARKVIKLSEAEQYLWHSVTLRGKVLAVRHTSFPKPGRTSITITDDSKGLLYLVYFAFSEWIAKQYKEGDEVVAVGYINMFRGDPQIVHPEFIEKVTESKQLMEGRMLPVYPSSQVFKEVRLSQMQLRSMLEQVMSTKEFKDATVEVLPETILASQNYPSRYEAICTVHNPESPEALDHAKERLIYEELFFLQLRTAIERIRKQALGEKGIVFDASNLTTMHSSAQTHRNDSLIQQVLSALPFTLTGAQQRVVAEISLDMSKKESKLPMNRLVQGDVGSGKTVVALLAMLVAVENGFQAALMAPTEVLAKQHYETITKLTKDTPIHVSMLIGGQAKKLRTEVLADLAEGRTNIIIGTHALIEEKVEFEKLGLVVADEQHKFGVAQRKALNDKYTVAPPDILIMTATPIPRTLALTLYQDLEVSTIDELPSGRKQIVTSIVMPSGQRALFTKIREYVTSRKEQVYIVFPQLQKSETRDVKTAISSFEIFRDKIFPDLNVGLIHGKLKSDEKQEVMKAFREREIDILVATSVIEVGIDVPNATLMIVANAERFGLAQLHQLRGRVGRGGKQSECILVPSDKLEPSKDSAISSDDIEARNESLERLEILASTTDGFKIAKADLAMRGPGDFLGTQQSGSIKLKIADLTRDEAVLEQAANDVKKIVSTDPQLRSKDHLNTRQELLRLYHQKESYLEVG